MALIWVSLVADDGGHLRLTDHLHSSFVQMPTQILSWVVFVAAWTMAACGCLVSTGMSAAVELTDYSQEVSVVDDNGDLCLCGPRAPNRGHQKCP